MTGRRWTSYHEWLAMLVTISEDKKFLNIYENCQVWAYVISERFDFIINQETWIQFLMKI